MRGKKTTGNGEAYLIFVSNATNMFVEKKFSCGKISYFMYDKREEIGNFSTCGVI